MTAGTPESHEGTPANRASEELGARCNAIEEAYEFMLAYAAQGLSSDIGSGSGGQVREYLRRCDEALTGLADLLNECVDHLGPDSGPAYRDFVGLLGRDSRDAQVTLRLARAQPGISSQLIDNLNASIHLRTLLTDLFLIDEILKSHRRS